MIKVHKVVIVILVALGIFAACDGLPYRVTVEYVPEECAYQYHEEEEFSPNIIDPYSEDTNWYIDETGNIIWRKKNY